MSNRVPKTRLKILHAALDLLESGKGESVRLNDVAKHAGVTRQTLYLYFKTRADLLIETTFYVDELKGSAARLAASREAKTGPGRLEAYVSAWSGYIPEIYGAARALMAMNDPDADAAWATRKQDMWEGCEAAVKALKRDGRLNPAYSVKDASDLLWTLLSVRNWEHLVLERKWSQRKYARHMLSTAQQLFVVRRA